MGGVLFLLKREFGLVAAAPGVLKATSAVGRWLWSGVPVWAIVLAVTLSLGGCLQELGRCPHPPRVPPMFTVVFTQPLPGPRCAAASLPTTPLLLEGRHDPSVPGRAAGTCYEVTGLPPPSETPGG